jgi:RNA polymerase sigma factor (sigma-70 family)
LILHPAAGVTIVETDTPIPSRPNVTRLLDEFVVQGGEQAFCRVVEHLQPFVYSTALRRTGDRQMAEDVTQSVFISIARMAPQLRKHAQPMAWIAQAVHFTAMKAIRSEQRKQRKHAAFAAEPGRVSETREDSRWDEAIPHLDASLGSLAPTDHELILLRFYEGRRFAEIADRLGSTEAACKMRLKRALEKLSRLLASKGVVVPVAVLGSCLTAEFAKAVPLASAAKIAAGALSPTATGLLTIQSIGIMSTAKSATITAAAVLALAGIPLSIQASRLNATGAELASLEKRLATLDGPSRRAGPGPRLSRPVTVRDLLGTGGNEDTQAVLTRLLSAAMDGDETAMLRAYASLGDLDAGRYAVLIAEAKAYPGSIGARQRLLKILAEFAPIDARAGEIDKLMADNHAPAAGKLLRNWAKDDPEAAIRWFHENRAAGKLTGPSVIDQTKNQTEINLLNLLLSGVVQKDPARAVDLLYSERGTLSDNEWHDAADDVARKMGELLADGKGAAEFKAFLAKSSDPDLRGRLVDEAARRAVPRGDLDAAARFIGEYLEGPARDEVLLSRIVYSGEEFDTQFANAKRLLNDVKEADAIKKIVGAHFQTDLQGLRAWVDGFPAGEDRDAGLGAITRVLSVSSEFTEALAVANRIADPATKSAAIQDLAMEWMQKDAAGARAALPAEIIRTLPQQ